MTGSSALVGVTIALQAVPAAAFGLMGGLVADRFPRRRVLIVTQLAQASIAVILAVLYVTSALPLGVLLVGAVLSGVVLAVDGPASAAFTADVVGAKHIGEMVALGGAVTSAGRVLGIALGGIVVSTCGVAAAFS